jgi:phosphoribosylglycinamide formyltransferase 2
MTKPGASAVIYGGVDSENISYSGLEAALAIPNSEVRLFGKPAAFVHRRMGVALATANDVDEARANAKRAASLVKTRGN